MSGTCDQKSARNGWVPFLLMKKRCTPLAFCGIKKSKGYLNYLNGTSWPRHRFFSQSPDIFILEAFKLVASIDRKSCRQMRGHFFIISVFIWPWGPIYTPDLWFSCSDAKCSLCLSGSISQLKELYWISPLLVKLLPEQTPFLVIQSEPPPMYNHFSLAWSFQENSTRIPGFYDIFASSSYI